MDYGKFPCWPKYAAEAAGAVRGRVGVGGWTSEVVIVSLSVLLISFTDQVCSDIYNQYTNRTGAFSLPDPRGAGLHEAFQISSVRPSVRTSVSTLDFSFILHAQFTSDPQYFYRFRTSYQRWTIGSNLEPDRSGPLELWRLRSAPEILEMELFGSDRLLETLRWSFGSDRLRLYWSCSIFYNILYPLESSLSSLRAAYDSKTSLDCLRYKYKRVQACVFSRHWLATVCQLAGKTESYPRTNTAIIRHIRINHKNSTFFTASYVTRFCRSNPWSLTLTQAILFMLSCPALDVETITTPQLSLAACNMQDTILFSSPVLNVISRRSALRDMELLYLCP